MKKFIVFRKPGETFARVSADRVETEIYADRPSFVAFVRESVDAENVKTERTVAVFSWAEITGWQEDAA